MFISAEPSWKHEREEEQKRRNKASHRQNFVGWVSDDLLVYVFSFFDFHHGSLCNASLVSRRWYFLFNDEILWLRIYTRRFVTETVKDRVGKRARSASMEDSDHQGEGGGSNKTWRRKYAHRHCIERNWSSGLFVQKKILEEKGKIFDLLLRGSEAFVAHESGTIGRVDMSRLCDRGSLVGHLGPVLCLDTIDRFLLSGSRDHAVRLWDRESGQCQSVWVAHFGPIHGIAADDMTRRVVTASADTNLKVWDMCTGRCVQTFSGHRRGVHGVTVSGDIVISGSQDSTVRIWDIRVPNSVQVITNHKDWVLSVELCGDTLVTADKTVHLWDMRMLRLHRTLQSHRKLITRVRQDGDRAVSCSLDGTIKMSKWDNSYCASYSTGWQDMITSLDFDEVQLISGGVSGGLCVWNFDEDPLALQPFPISPDLRLAASA
eukprot:GILJ01006621.1.p1 GENE.GILJ01006621.1~~GILJ01006621.1.p1  ORF type:complete len:473 (+),score=52.20 GILJ01006621.1:124-1419(+)